MLDPLGVAGGVAPVVAHRQLEAVGPVVAELRVEPDERYLVGQGGARQPEQFVEHLWQGDERRPDVEREPVALADGQLATGHLVAFEHHHMMARSA